VGRIKKSILDNRLLARAHVSALITRLWEINAKTFKVR
jgi:hypothetical protein